MGDISQHVKIFNAAFKIAWDLSVEDSKLVPGIAPKISEEIRKLLKAGARDPAEIGRTAYHNACR